MSREQLVTVTVRKAVEPRLQALAASAAACLRRYQSAAVGDESEVHRYQQVQAEIQAIGYSERLRQQASPDGIASHDLGTMTIELLWPFAVGGEDDSQRNATKTRRPVKEMWKPGSGVRQLWGTRGYKRGAVTERFERQLAAWLDGASSVRAAPPTPVCPSDIPNRVLSESLRRFFAAESGQQRVAAAVEYRDGSVARPLPLRSLAMTNAEPSADERRLRLTLMSVRHMTVDAVVDGAWLRNREISVRRAFADTDELVYRQSREQFAALSRREPIVIELFQTGLEGANVGFYRALVDHHLEASGHPVTVLPRYYEGRDDGTDDFAPGTIWRVVT